MTELAHGDDCHELTQHRGSFGGTHRTGFPPDTCFVLTLGNPPRRGAALAGYRARPARCPSRGSALGKDVPDEQESAASRGSGGFGAPLRPQQLTLRRHSGAEPSAGGPGSAPRWGRTPQPRPGSPPPPPRAAGGARRDQRRVGGGLKAAAGEWGGTLSSGAARLCPAAPQAPPDPGAEQRSEEQSSAARRAGRVPGTPPSRAR